MNDNYSPTHKEKSMAMFCHFAAFAGFVFPLLGSVLGPLIIWQMKRHESEYVDYHGKEALNFQLTMLIAFFIAFVLVFVVVGIPLLFGLAIFEIIVIIIAGIKANDGVFYRYPFSIRFIQ
ncbi:MAG: DUF4870 domain-containing protein [Kangiellaceae bacterium]|nr:DUF4870 domain-containing protein [Kangiellaceae bacterium]MCW8999358.1 DUF4870 domain-containing protein [Kangiellaceae bacterium]MCW9015347.1 DUF4870 domain-containing protein [Kangiellaceae bacterium]